MRKLARRDAYPYSACLFFFTMQDDKAHYTWVAEPTLDPDGQPDLIVHEEANCATLDRNAIDAIVQKVDEWSDARRPKVRPPTGKHRSGPEVLDAILNAQADYVASHNGTEPTILELPLLLAYDLAKLGRDRLGGLADKLMENGAGALEGQKLYGMTVHLVRNADEIAVQ
jgi:hypothetical protein